MFKWFVPLVVCVLSVFALADGPAAATPAATSTGQVQVLFSPRGGCTDAIVERVNMATKSVDLMAYSMTSAPIAKALTDAHARGVKVRAVLDKSNWTSQYSAATFLLNQGVATYIDAEHAIMHNKVIIIDRETVITGSFNFSAAAETSNAENVVFLSGFADVTAAYVENFEHHLSHSERYTGPRSGIGSTPAPLPAAPQTATPAPVTPPAGVQSDAAQTVYRSRTGERYHRSNCRTLRSGGTPISLSDARSRGLTACGVCNP